MPTKIHTLLFILLLNCAFVTPKLSSQTIDRKVRVIYLVPNDKKINNTYKLSIEKAILNVQKWYLQKTGKTFNLNSLSAEVINSAHSSSWYNNTKSKYWSDNRMFWFISNAMEDVMNLAGATFNDSKFIWVIYVDAEGATGAGLEGMAALPLHDILGISGIHPTEKKRPKMVWWSGS